MKILLNGWPASDTCSISISDAALFSKKPTIPEWIAMAKRSYHDAILRWLRKYEERGIRPFADIPKPLHELRKEAGTLVNSQRGLNEAKNFSRHSSISISTPAAYYVGSTGNITTGLS